MNTITLAILVVFENRLSIMNISLRILFDFLILNEKCMLNI